MGAEQSGPEPEPELEPDPAVATAQRKKGFTKTRGIGFK
eukprot:SAG11_NODE_22062_length_413_cov_0.573248_2_plen_38_part_01